MTYSDILICNLIYFSHISRQFAYFLAFCFGFDLLSTGIHWIRFCSSKCFFIPTDLLRWFCLRRFLYFILYHCSFFGGPAAKFSTVFLYNLRNHHFASRMLKRPNAISHDEIVRLAYCVRVSDFLSGSSILPSSLYSYDFDSHSDGENVVSAGQPAPVYSLSGAVLPPTSPDSNQMSIGSHRSQVESDATFASEEGYNTIIEHLSVLYSSLWSSIWKSPSLVPWANTDQAPDNHDVILAYIHSLVWYGNVSAFSAFFEFLSLPVEKLLIKIDPHQKHLYERVIDDV